MPTKEKTNDVLYSGVPFENSGDGIYRIYAIAWDRQFGDKYSRGGSRRLRNIG